MSIKVGCKSDVGKKRAIDEDSIVILRVDKVYQSKRAENGLFIVADGVGGEAKGEVASQLAARTVAEELHPVLLQDKTEKNPSENIHSSLESAINKANKIILDYTDNHKECEGMGSTVTMALLIGDQLYVANVGDSRTYIIEEEKTIKQITKDHTQVQEMVDSGVITPEDAKTPRPEHVKRIENIITSAVGIGIDLKVDTFQRTLYRGDYLLLCCDGLTDLLSDKEIKEAVLKSNDPQNACEKLVDMANDRGGKDNISVIVVDTKDIPWLCTRQDILNEKTVTRKKSDKMKKIKVIKETLLNEM